MRPPPVEVPQKTGGNHQKGFKEKGNWSKRNDSGRQEWAPKGIIDLWETGKLTQTVETFAREMNIRVPKDIGAQIDYWKVRAEKLYGNDINLTEFYALAVAVATTSAGLYVTFTPWKVRMLIGLIIGYLWRSHIAIVIVVISLIPRLWNTTTHKMRIEEKGSGTLMIIGTSALLLALSGRLPFSWTIAIITTGTAIFAMGCLKKAANHSIAGVNISVTATGIVATIMLGLSIAYYHHTAALWQRCGAFEGEKWRLCASTYVDHKFNKTMEDMRLEYQPVQNNVNIWNIVRRGRSDINIFPLLALSFTLAAMALPAMINVMGPKYKLAGYAHSAAKNRSKSESVVNLSSVKVHLTLADFSVTGDSAPIYGSWLVSIGLLFVDPLLGITLATLIAISQTISYTWFKWFLAPDYAEEGGKLADLKDKLVVDNGITKLGASSENLLPQKSSLAVIGILSASCGMSGMSTIGLVGALAAMAPGVVYYAKPSYMGKTALITYMVTCIATMDYYLAIGAVIVTMASINKYTMRIKTAKTEEVAGPIPEDKTTPTLVSTT